MTTFFIVLAAVQLLLPAADEPVILVNKAVHELVVYEDGEQMFHAPAAIGKTDELTPEGLFQVKVKAVDPYYRKNNIPGGVPENPLGSRWIGFDAEGTDGRIYGIHGTNQPESIGTSASAGCIRLQNVDVEALYAMVEKNTNVWIVDQPDVSMEDLYEHWLKKKWQQFLN
ncbi:L,D-transpeptidase [Halobacillus litoralis]|uniref:L,D-transpeptidase n=1 Tax=Halobacillus litoralis TaxID=45668 RepID=UPI001CD4BD0B|nr:L,D-transpeptidase [Halobacillus litoralis]MCA1022958.1 L,D-transpeptidase [Halobacillus litoralis]